MSTGWQCGRCGTMYGWIRPPANSVEVAIVRAMTDKTILASHEDFRRILFRRCLTEKCPTTTRALLWRLFGRRGHRGTGWRPNILWGLRSLRHGDPLYLPDTDGDGVPDAATTPASLPPSPPPKRNPDPTPNHPTPPRPTPPEPS